MSKRNFGSYKEYWESLKGKVPISIQMQRDRGVIKTIERVCPYCKELFTSYKCEKKVYCSKECYTNYGRADFICAYAECGKKFMRKKVYQNTKRYCSQKCLAEDRRNPLTAPYKNLSRTGLWKQWRNQVLKRDNYMCINCGSTENLEADHKEPVVKLILENRINEIFDVDNGRTLCEKCHKITPTWGSKARLLIKEEMEQQIIERMVN